MCLDYTIYTWPKYDANGYKHIIIMTHKTSNIFLTLEFWSICVNKDVVTHITICILLEVIMTQILLSIVYLSF